MKGIVGTAVRLGLVTVVGLASFGWLAVRIGQLSGPAGALASTYKVSARFTDATGLAPGDDVRLAGVRIGKVAGVDVERGKAVVSLAVDKRYPLPSDFRMELHWRNLLGQRYIEVVPRKGATTGSSVRSGRVVDTRQTAAAADLSMLLNNTEPLLSKLDTPALNRVTSTLAAALQGRERALGETISQSSRLVSTLSARSEAISRSVTDLATLVGGIAGRDQQVRALLESMASTSQTLAARSDDLGRAVSGTARLSEVLDRVLAANGGSIDTVLGQARQILDRTVANKAALGEAIQTLPWATSAITRVTGDGDWFQVYARGVGIVDTFVSEPRVGPDYNDAGPDDNTAPDALLGTPRIPAPAVPELQLGPLTVNPEPHSPSGSSADLGRLLAPLLGRGGAR